MISMVLDPADLELVARLLLCRIYSQHFTLPELDRLDAILTSQGDSE